MLATLGIMPRHPEEYGFEFKWDGYRALCFWDGKRLAFRTRNHIDITFECASLYSSPPRLGKFPVILDGEVIAANSKGHSDFGLLQEHFGFRRRKISHSAHLFYMIFDILFFKTTSMTSFTFLQRRAFLEKFPFKNARWRLSPCTIGSGKKLCLQAKRRGMEGIIAKRLHSIYQTGRRSPDWIKVKFIQEQEFVVGGWMKGEGSNEGSMGSLMMGYYAKPSDPFLSYAGNVGTGYTQKDRQQLKSFLIRHASDQSPFGKEAVPRGASFTKPLMVVEIEFRGWTRDGKLRQAAFKGLRIDKNPREVRRES